MFSTLRTRFGIPGVISVIAVVFAMFGGAYAASNSSGGGKATASAKAKKGPRGPKGATGPAGPAGPQGPAGPAGAKGDAGAAGANGTPGTPGAAGQSVQTAVEPPLGNCGEEGGVKLTSASGTSYVCNGEKGGQGPEGNPWTDGGTLPSGETETGTWGGAINKFRYEEEEDGTLKEIVGGAIGYLPISIPIPLAAAPNPVLVEPGETGVPGCPGISPGGLPQADPGTLCVYGASLLGSISGTALLDPTKNFSPGAARTGTLFLFECAGGECAAFGTWAVTAPE